MFSCRTQRTTRLTSTSWSRLKPGNALRCPRRLLRGVLRSRRSRLPAFLVEVLAEHLASYRSTEGLVFPSSHGGPLRASNVRRRVWRPAVRASVSEPCRFHDLRHSHAALLIAHGEQPKVIQQRLGHASIRTTLDTYGRLFDGLDEAATERLNAAWHNLSSLGTRATGSATSALPRGPQSLQYSLGILWWALLGSNK